VTSDRGKLQRRVFVKVHWYLSTCQAVKLWLASFRSDKVVHNQIRSVILSDPPTAAKHCKQRMMMLTGGRIRSLFGSFPTPSGNFPTLPARFSSLLGIRIVTMLLWWVEGPVPGRATVFDAMPYLGGNQRVPFVLNVPMMGFYA
jgi:hypothetical protein